MRREINVGLIGYQFMGKAHSFAYRNLPMFFKTHSVPVMKIICGRTEARVAEAAKTFGWQEHKTSWKEVIQREDINLIDIVSPNATHKDIAVEAAKTGKHILCEKPLATNFADAKKMLEAVESTGIKHMVCFNYRKAPAVSLAKKIIEEGQLGKIYHFRAVYLQDWPADHNFPMVWKLNKQSAGSGVHGDLNSHLVDLARFLVGDFAKVIGMQETFIRKRPILGETFPKQGEKVKVEESDGEMEEVKVDDATLFLARFKNGALGSFEATRFAHGRRNGQRIEVNGSKGSLVFELEDMNILWFYSCEDANGLQGFRRIQATEPTHPYMSSWWAPGHIIGYENTFVHVIYDFMKAIDKDRIPLPNFEDGLECQRVLEAVEISVQEERWVNVNEID